MMANHITVCICTFKRPRILLQLLEALTGQVTSGFTYSALVVDNDRDKSAEAVVRAFQETKRLPVQYHVEPVAGIPVARNRAASEARGDFLAFIDDDEIPNPDWLLKLFNALREHDASGVLGPVKSSFEVPPPEWIIKGRLFERRSFQTGTRLNWPDTRTGNVLLKQAIFNEADNFFNPKIGHGEDKDFFRRLMAKDHTFVWCNEAIVSEIQPPERLKRSYFLKRALVRGSYYMARARCKPLQFLESLIAMPAYSLALPLTTLLGQHVFMKMLIRVCDHLGSLLGACGLDIEKLFRKA